MKFHHAVVGVVDVDALFSSDTNAFILNCKIMLS